MKILTIIENYNPYIVGGAELTIESYINYISKKYHVKYRILTGIHTKINGYQKIKSVHRLLRGVDSEQESILVTILNININILNIILLIIMFRPSIIEFVPNNYSLYPLILFVKLIKYPFIISIHNNSFSNNVISTGDWISYIKKQIINNVNNKEQASIITISKFMKRKLISAGFKSTKIKVLYNPITTMYKLSTKGNYVVFASRLVEDRGVNYILEAFKKLKNNKILIFGDGPLKNKVINISSKYNNIIYMGKVTEKQIISYIRDSFCIIAHPLADEAFGRFVIHSFSTLKPLIATYSGAIPEMITNNHTGLLVKKRNKKAIIEAVTILSNNKNLYNKIVLNLKAERSKYLISKIAEKRLDIIYSLVNVN